MSSRADVSILILTYEPNADKLIKTLNSVIKQKGIRTEIIISDDGSHCFPDEEVRRYISGHDAAIKVIKNEINLGTVKNCLNAVSSCEGKYVFATSPGDYLYDVNTLSCFFGFAEKNNEKIVFGDAVNYRIEGGRIVFENNMMPLRPKIYEWNNTLIQQTEFFFGKGVLGASFFRERETFLKYLKKAANDIKYSEDTATTAYFLADGNTVSHYGRKIVWYEYGSGISTKKSRRWKEILDAEYERLYTLIANECKNPVCKAYIDFISRPRGVFRAVRLLVHHPLIGLIHLLGKFSPKKSAVIDSENSEKRFLKAVSDTETGFRKERK